MNFPTHRYTIPHIHPLTPLTSFSHSDFFFLCNTYGAKLLFFPKNGYAILLMYYFFEKQFLLKNLEGKFHNSKNTKDFLKIFIFLKYS